MTDEYSQWSREDRLRLARIAARAAENLERNSQAIDQARRAAAQAAAPSLAAFAPALVQAVDAVNAYRGFVERNWETIDALRRTLKTTQDTIEAVLRDNHELTRVVIRAAQMYAAATELPAETRRPADDTTSVGNEQKPSEQAAADVAAELVSDENFSALLDEIPATVDEGLIDGAGHSTLVDVDPTFLRILLALMVARAAATMTFDHPEVKALFDNVMFIVEVALFVMQFGGGRRDSND